MKVAVIGQGYVGQTIAFYAAQNHDVVGFDLNLELVHELNSGITRIEGLDSDLLTDSLKNGTYQATNNPNLINGADIAVIAVPTPLDANRKPDLSFIKKACETIGKNLKNQALIINESTSYPGTVRNFIKPLLEVLSPNIKHLYAVSPERVDPGRLDWNQTNTPRLYSGLTIKASEETAKFYGSFCSNLVEVSTPEVAEAAKLFENTFRQINIALVNEFAQISHALGLPVREVLEAANSKPYGFMKFNPSAGVGGHCIPVDPSYLAHVAEENGVKARFIELANQVNLQMGRYIVERVKTDNGNSLNKKKVQIIGVAYKVNVSDCRETPAEHILEALKNEGAIVSWHDPLVNTWLGNKSSDMRGDIAIVVTKHDCIDNNKILKSFKYVFDTTGTILGASQL